jgi:hypothetical protein
MVYPTFHHDVAVPTELILDPKLTLHEKFIYVVLSCFAREQSDGTRGESRTRICSLSQRALAGYSGLSERCLREHLLRLERRGCISIQKSGREKVYALLLSSQNSP